MQTTNTLLAVTILAAATAQVRAHELPERLSMEKFSTARQLQANPAALRVIDFWKEAGPELWFAKNEDFDRRFRERFLRDHEAAARGELVQWQSTPEGTLALLLLLDQFPRNAFRGTPRMYDTDAMARKVANIAYSAGFERSFSPELQTFFLLPFGHSEDLVDQERAVALARGLTPVHLAHAEHHRDIVRRFGRFPHRNAILHRESTTDEAAYLANGGYQG